MFDAPANKTEGMAAGYQRERVKELRKALGLTQGALALKAGTHQADISRIEKGETEITSDRKKLAALAAALGVSVSAIYEDDIDEGPALHPDSVDRAPTANAAGPMQGALLRLIGTDDGGSFAMEDLDVVRQTINETALYMEGADPGEIVRSWLRAARYFRLRNVKPTPTQVVARAQAGFSAQSERANAEAMQRTADEATERARAMGLDEPSPTAANARARATATIAKTRKA